MTRRPTNTTTLAPFASDVLEGLSANPPTLSSKYFYDERGNELFREIMRTPEYYLTDAEREIFADSASELADIIGPGAFDLIELGAGDGSKTRLLIDGFLDEGLRFTYRPVDLNAAAIDELKKLVALNWPQLPFTPIQDDYFSALDRLGQSLDGQRRVVLFPGANIGNYTPEQAMKVLSNIREFLTPHDLLLTGFDLRKDPAIILSAYNDAAGCTAAFNLNLLQRINRELGGNFVLDNWRHWETYDPSSGAARSYLVPISDQRVSIDAVDTIFDFLAWQGIAVEVSQKYSLAEIEDLARRAGFRHRKHFRDSRGYFSDSLWELEAA